MAHSHAHDHHHGPANYDRPFFIGIILNVSFVVIEIIYGFAAESLALLADAGHNFSDVLSLVLAWTATWLARRRPSNKRTYGFGKSSILASLINSIILLAAIGAIGWEAIQRLGNPTPVATTTVMIVAAVGTVINTATALLFLRGSKHDLNIRGAFLHMAADAGVSLGVVIAALLMRVTGMMWIDPVVSLAIVAVIAIGTWGLLRDSLNLTLDAVPRSIDRQEVERYLANLPGVETVHDLHIWALSTSSVALTVHLINPEAEVDDTFLAAVSKELHDRFNIDHATIQMERGNCGEFCWLNGEHRH